jgi:hypothetical protein
MSKVIITEKNFEKEIIDEVGFLIVFCYKLSSVKYDVMYRTMLDKSTEFKVCFVEFNEKNKEILFKLSIKIAPTIILYDNQAIKRIHIGSLSLYWLDLFIEEVLKGELKNE